MLSRLPKPRARNNMRPTVCRKRKPIWPGGRLSSPQAGKTPIGTAARGATQMAEDARVLTLRRKEQERIAREKQAMLEKQQQAEADAQASAEAEAQGESAGRRGCPQTLPG